jgi:membrane fusion protein (multidrug efflux system)
MLSATPDSAASDTTKKLPLGIPVKVEAVQVGEIADYVLFNTTVEAEEMVDVYAQATGLVEAVLVEEGDEVRKGDVLVRLVDDDLKLAAETALLKYQQKQSQFKRKQEIFARNLLSKEEYEQFELGLEQERITWERALLAMENATVRAPADGVVSERIVKLGDRISAANKLMVLIDLRRLIARVHVSVKEILRLRVGQQARLSADLYPNTVFDAEVIRISPVVNPASGTFKVTLRLKDSDGRIRPGMFVTAHVVTEVRSAALLISKKAVVYEDGEPHAFVVRDSTAQKVALTVGFQDIDHLQVMDGLKGGDPVVVVGQNGLKDGAHVRVIPGPGLMIPAAPDSSSSPEKSAGASDGETAS